MSGSSGSREICEALAAAGIGTVFGLPGTQNVPLFEALRTSPLRTVVATTELSASMMANGWFRASGRPAALMTIPGPGYTWALTGLAEAALDSVALLHLVGAPAASPGHAFQLQAIDQAAIAAPLVRAAHALDEADSARAVIASAFDDATGGEPGPVIVQIARTVLDETISIAPQPARNGPARPPIDGQALEAAARMVSAARRIVVIAGQGCQEAGDALATLAEALEAPVVTTTSGRGCVAEDHRLSFGFEFAGNGARTLDALIEACDAILAIGCKFSHNGSRGFALRLPEDKLVHVDTAAHVLGANYPARVALRADAGDFIAALRVRIGAAADGERGFAPAELARFRARARIESVGEIVEPRIHGVDGGRPAAFFDALRAAMPRESVLVTDSGLHQMLARAHFRVLCARGLIVPTNLQSMGFGIGAAIGAGLARPDRPVVALIGDGGLAFSGLELLTAVREQMRLVVIVFVDGAFGLIRFQQIASTGRPFATDLPPLDVAAFAESIGVRHMALRGDAEATLRDALASEGVTIVEVAVGDSLPLHWMRAKSVARGWAGPRARAWLRRIRRR